MADVLNLAEELLIARGRVIEGFYKFLVNRAPTKEELEYYVNSEEPLDIIYVEIKASFYSAAKNKDRVTKLPITLATFVKNAENSLGMVLDNVKDVVSEIVVVDTGSEDRTLEVAERYGARTYEIGFSDFGNIRSITAHLANCSWVLMLDSDEILEPSKLHMLSELVSDVSADVWALPRRRWSDLEMTKQEELEAYPDWQYRLFKNDTTIRFSKRVHEELVGTSNIKKAMGGPHIEHFQSVFKVGEKLKRRNKLYRELYDLDTKDGIKHSCPPISSVDE